MARKQSFEQSLAKLSDIVDRMEDSETGLDECVKLYKEGVSLAVECARKLDDIKERVAALTRDAEDGFSQEPFGE